MTTFWILVALLSSIALLLAVAVLAMRRRRMASSGASPDAMNESSGRLTEDAAAFEEESILSSWRTLLVAALLLVPVLTIALYLILGKPEALHPRPTPAEQPQGATPAQIEAMVKGLEQKLVAQPDNAKGWAMLGNSYAVLGRYTDSMGAYARAAALTPNNAQLLADYADVIAMSQGKIFQGEPEKLIQQALKIDSGNIKALALAGSAAFQRKDYRAAMDYWQRQLTLLPANSGLERTVSVNIAEARKLSAQPPAGAVAK